MASFYSLPPSLFPMNVQMYIIPHLPPLAHWPLDLLISRDLKFPLDNTTPHKYTASETIHSFIFLFPIIPPSLSHSFTKPIFSEYHNSR